jgi:hypothetical protein
MLAVLTWDSLGHCCIDMSFLTLSRLAERLAAEHSRPKRAERLIADVKRSRAETLDA